jgi:hypothetical protein
MRGRTIPLSAPRRFVNDLLRAAAGVPTVPVQRTMPLARLADARAHCEAKPTWTALFTLAYARVCREYPELRRAYLKWPTARLYEYPVSVAAVAVERDIGGEKAVLVGKLKDPAAMTMAAIDAAVTAFRTAPVESVKDFRRALYVASLPLPLRRLVWGVALNCGRQRGNYVGTFGVTAYSALGAESLHPISPCTTTLTYGVMGKSGETTVRLIYDHRVLDGATVARALERLEREFTLTLPLELATRLATPAPRPRLAFSPAA